MGRGIEEAKNQNCISQLEQNFCATPTPTGCWRGVLLEFRISFTLCIYLENQQQQRLKRITCKTFPCITTTGVRSFVSSTATGTPFFLSLYYITFRLPVTSFFFFLHTFGSHFGIIMEKSYLFRRRRRRHLWNFSHDEQSKFSSDISGVTQPLMANNANRFSLLKINERRPKKQRKNKISPLTVILLSNIKPLPVR